MSGNNNSSSINKKEVKKCSKCNVDKILDNFIGENERNLKCCLKCRNKDKKHKSILNVKLKNYERCAIDRKLKWELEDSVAKDMMEENCFYCDYDNNSLIGIDRLCNEENYTIDNTVGCCEVCNRLKGGLDPDTFINRCRHISSLNGGPGELQPDSFRDSWSSTYYSSEYYARARKLEFDLSEEEFKKIKESKCFYCKKENNEDHYNGVDRKNNTDGYTVENSVSACTDCNLAKRDHTTEEFIKYCKNVAKFRISSGKNVKKSLIFINRRKPGNNVKEIYSDGRRDYLGETLPVDCLDLTDKIPKNCFYIPPSTRYGDGFGVNNRSHSIKEYTTTRSTYTTTRQKFEDLIVYLRTGERVERYHFNKSMPEDSILKDSDIPEHCSYVKANATLEASFYVTKRHPFRKCWKTTMSKHVSITQKLLDLIHYLKTGQKTQHQIEYNCEFLKNKGIKLQKHTYYMKPDQNGMGEGFWVSELHQVNHQYNRRWRSSRSKFLTLEDKFKEMTEYIESNGVKHRKDTYIKREIPKEKNIKLSDIPSFCYYMHEGGDKGDGFRVSPLHSIQINSGKEWVTSRLKNISTKDKLKSLNEYLNSEGVIDPKRKEEVKEIPGDRGVYLRNLPKHCSYIKRKDCFQVNREHPIQRESYKAWRTTGASNVSLKDKFKQLTDYLESNGNKDKPLKTPKKLPEDSNSEVLDVPEFCSYLPANDKKGDGFRVNESHPFQKSKEKPWSTTRSKKITTKEKLVHLHEYIESNGEKDIKENQGHKNLPENCGVILEDVPEFCSYLHADKTRGDGFKIKKNHPLQKNKGKPWSTTRSSTFTTKEKLVHLLEYIESNGEKEIKLKK